MNRQQWYKQRQLFRIKKLVYFSYGDEVPTKVYEAYEHFDPTIKLSVETWEPSTSAFNIPELFARTARIRSEVPKRLPEWYETVRECMRSNAKMVRVKTTGSSPFGTYKLTPYTQINLP